MLTGTRGPAAMYEAAIASGEIQPDDAQAVAISHLQALHDGLLASTARPAGGFMARLFRRKGRSQPAPKGLYFWGGVGRGKTYMMDLFFDTLPFPDKTRLHFHRFMRHVHGRLRALQGQPNPLREVAAEFARDSRVLCFDEFFVSDITDAMILANLLEALFERGMVLVATSNVEPDHLYENGLQRRKFLPAIDLLNSHTRVLNVDGGTDYRLRALEAAELYHSSLDATADASLAASFTALSPDEGERGRVLEIEGRPLTSRACGEGVVWFEFDELCDGPRSQNDYIELARIYQTVLISNVPLLDEDHEDQARRFISLVDEFYDHNVKLVISAVAPIAELYTGRRLRFEFQRTQSRLLEMQSREYLAREHKT